MNEFEAIIEAWQPFFIAQLGASATLLGLLFVGLSLNLAKIIANPALPTRALIALVLLLVVLIIASLMVIPHQGIKAIAIEVLVIGAGAWILMTGMDVHVYRYARLQSTWRYLGNMVLLQVAALPFVLGSVWLIGGNPNGLYAVAAGMILAFVKAVLDAWVLLVEINR
jgi:modulator of FtsH protease